MKANFVAAVLCAAALVEIVAAAASANPADGPYLRLEGGATLPSNMSATGPSGLDFNLSPSDGPIRLEVDVDWMHSSITSSAPALTGTVQNIPVMMNGYVDWVNRTRFEPYLGFGVGFTAMTLKANAPGGARLIDSSERVFAFQPLVGVNLDLTDQVTVGVQYRYFRSVDPGLITAASQRFSVTNASHNVLATLTYHFFSPAPPPVEATSAAETTIAPTFRAPTPMLAAPPVAGAAPRMFFVFFDFGSAKLTAAGRRSANEAITSYQQDPSNAVEVRGFTDLVGSDAYNLELSKKRALTVYDYFTAHGVKPSDMGIDWEGKADPRVQTDKREPQNRRVEIQM
jgi:outer membrane protein OmpA-like peptidoglycan-associated protein